jgi:hypothetical protein
MQEETDQANATDESEGLDESGAAKSDREDGGPTSAEDAEGGATGGAHGTKPSQFEPHE